jgi:hypothetical protein
LCPAEDSQRIINAGFNRRDPFFLPVRVLSRVFRGKFVAGLKELFRRNHLRFSGNCQALSVQKTFSAFLRTLFRADWVVYAKPPFGGPEHVLHYLARYTHRVAISNHRLLHVSNHEVTFRWKDYTHHQKRRVMTLTLEEFLRRFIQHVLPRGFPRIRYFGFLANRRRRSLLPLCRTLFGAYESTSPNARVSDSLIHSCPRCRGTMNIVERFTAAGLNREVYQQVAVVDSS